MRTEGTKEGDVMYERLFKKDGSPDILSLQTMTDSRASEADITCNICVQAEFSVPYVYKDGEIKNVL